MATRHFKTGDDFPEKKEGLLRIYSMRFCPFDQRTRLVLAHKNIPHEKVFVNLKDKPEWFLARNPKGTVPTIELPDGRVLWESAIINDYLDEVYPDKKLNLDDPYEKAKQKVILESLWGNIVQVFFKGLKNPDALDEVKPELKKHFKAFNDELKDTFFGGKSPSVLDYNLWPMVEKSTSVNTAGLRKWFDDNFPDEFPKLQRWIDAMMELPAVKETYVEPETYARYVSGYIAGNPEYDF